MPSTERPPLGRTHTTRARVVWSSHATHARTGWVDRRNALARAFVRSFFPGASEYCASSRKVAGGLWWWAQQPPKNRTNETTVGERFLLAHLAAAAAGGEVLRVPTLRLIPPASSGRKVLVRSSKSLRIHIINHSTWMEKRNKEDMGPCQRNSSPKVHSSMCIELTMMLDKVSSILPSIEAARPGCRAGIQELCNLYNIVEKGKLIIQHCTECSKLYLAITGEAIVSRCERIRDSLRRSLFLIQNMVPPGLANQIVEVHDDLRDIKFIIDTMEEEAGKIILEMLRQSDATEELELETFLQAASNLNLTSPKAMLIERRAIKKLLDKISGTDPKKEGVLKFLLYLVKKYGKSIKPETSEQNENTQSESQSSTPSSSFVIDASASGKYFTPTDIQRTEDHTSMSGGASPPAEFCCPISTKLMLDPVIITSGQTYERENIERWFREGYDTCPRTHIKLENFSMIPNTCMRDLIFNWCREHGFVVSDFVPPTKNAYNYLPEQLHGYSMSSLNNVSVPLIAGKVRDFVIDHSTSSLALSDASYMSDSSHVRDMEDPKDSFSQFSWNADYQECLSFRNFNQDNFLTFLCELSKLPLELQDRSIGDLKNILDDDNEVSCAMVSNGFVEAFLDFLTNDDGSYSMQAKKVGFQFFHVFLSNSRTKILHMNEEAFRLIASFLDSNLRIEALLILHELVQHPSCRQSHLMASIVAPPVFKILESEDANDLELCLKIVCSLSSDSDIKPYLISLGIISRLSAILSEGSFTECCLKILRNLCDVEEATELISKTDRCLGSVAEYLDTGNPKEREHAVVILLALCSHSTDDCLLVMKEGVIPALVDLSVNGIDEAKGCSMKLLHLLRDLRRNDQLSNSCSQEVAVTDEVEGAPDSSIRKQTIPKSSRFFQRKLNIFSKPRSLTLF
uniref:RING-type E3 ubiquitin transferase n=1 Tax=Leersia perrieri TaxID=77586 RepID=A0A0D9VK02_9ORYZ